MQTKKEEFDKLMQNGKISSGFLFRPILMHFAAKYYGITYGELASDYKKLVEANIHCMEDFNTDMVGLISDPYRETSAFGAPVQFIPDGVPLCRKLIVKSMNDIENLRIPDITKCDRTLDRIRGATYFQKLLKGTVPVIGWVEGPLAEACTLAGVSEILLKLFIDSDFVHKLMDKCLVTGINFAIAQINEGCDVIGIGDAICSQIDRDSYDRFVKERHKELIDAIHRKGSKVKMHICGDITHLLPSLKDLDIDILDLDWQVSLQESEKIMGEHVIRCGNINPVDIQNFTADELESLITTILNQEKGKRFILSGGCEITVLTPLNNVRLMGQLAKKDI